MEDKARPIARFPELIDLVEDGNSIKFLVLGDAGLPQEKSEWVGPNGEKWIPPRKKQVPFKVIPRLSKVLAQAQTTPVTDVTDSRLFRDVRDYLASAAVPPDPTEDWLNVFTSWVFHTYCQESIRYTPYICFFGVPERGKTRLGKALTYLSYRGYHTVSLRQPLMFRMAENFGATIFLDIMDLWSRAKSSGAEDILLLRYEADAMVDRVHNSDRGAFNDTEYYEIFGPTIIATNEPVHRILETRCLPVSMPDAAGATLGPSPTPDSARELRERLTAWRARFLFLERRYPGKVLPALQPFVPGRLGDVTQCLVQVVRAVDPVNEEGVLNVIRMLDLRRRESKAQTWEGEVVAALVKLRDKVSNQKFPTSFVTGMVNDKRDEREKLTPQKIGRLLSSLGVHTVKIRGLSHVIYDEFLVRKLGESWLTPDERLWTSEERVPPKNQDDSLSREYVENVDDRGVGLESQECQGGTPPPLLVNRGKLPPRPTVVEAEPATAPEDRDRAEEKELEEAEDHADFEEGVI